MLREDRVWQRADVADNFLEGVRGAIPLAAEQIEVMLRVIRGALPDGVSSFLDVGCGDGVLGRAISGQHPAAKGMLLDFSAPMLEAGRRKAGNNPHLTFIEDDYGTPAWVDAVKAHAPFDVIVSGFSIHHQPDTRKREVYAEIYALLRPGGLFLNLEHVAPPAAWVEGLFDGIMIDSMYGHEQRTGSGKSRDEAAAAFHARPDKEANILAPMEAQCNWLREIGYWDVDCFFKIFELALFGGIKPA